MRVLKGCNMISLDTYGGKSQVLLGFLLLASCVPLVRTTDYFSSDATASELMVGNRLVSPLNTYPEFGVFPYNCSGVATQGYDLAMRDALPIDPAITRMVNCNTPLPRAVVPLFHPNGFLKLSDQNQNSQRDNIWYTFTDNTDVVSAQLLRGMLYSGKKNGTKMSNQSTDRTSYLRNHTVGELPQPRVTKRDNKLAKILKWSSASAGVLLFVVAIFCLWRYEKVRQWLWACGRCGSCCRRPQPCYEIRFPDDMPVTVESGDGGVELEVEAREPAVYCTCTIQCSISSNHSRI